MKKLLVVSMMVVALAVAGFVPGTATGAVWKYVGSFGADTLQSANPAKVKSVIQAWNANEINSANGYWMLPDEIALLGGQFDADKPIDWGNFSITSTDDWKTGTWTAPSSVSYISIKGAQTVTVWYVGGVSSGNWTNENLFTPNGNNLAGLSNIAFWETPTTAVPIPGAAWLLGSGLLGLVALRRRQQKS